MKLLSAPWLARKEFVGELRIAGFTKIGLGKKTRIDSESGRKYKVTQQLVDVSSSSHPSLTVDKARRKLKELHYKAEVIAEKHGVGLSLPANMDPEAGPHRLYIHFYTLPPSLRQQR